MEIFIKILFSHFIGTFFALNFNNINHKNKAFNIFNFVINALFYTLIMVLVLKIINPYYILTLFVIKYLFIRFNIPKTLQKLLYSYNYDSFIDENNGQTLTAREVRDAFKLLVIERLIECSILMIIVYHLTIVFGLHL